MEISRHWRLRDTRYRLEGLLDEDGKPVFPRKPFSSTGAKTPIHPDYNGFRLSVEVETKLEEVLGSD